MKCTHLHPLLLTATLVPACALDLEDAPATDDRIQQATVVPGGICRTAAPRNPIRKRAALSEALRGRDAMLTLTVLRSTGSALSPVEFWAERAGGFSSADRWSAGDFDGDGDQDLVAAWDDNGRTTLTLRRAVGASFQTEHWAIRVPGGWAASTEWIPGDFDGDGDTDLAAVRNDLGFATTEVYLSTRTAFAPAQRWATRDGGFSSTTKWSTGDVNGDGRDDLVAAWNDRGFATLSVRRSTGASFVPEHWSIQVGGWDDATSYVAGDFTGDGKADLAGVWNNGGLSSIAVYPSTGTTFAFPGQWLHSAQWFSTDDRWVSGDFDADGKVDLAQAWENDRTSWRSVFLSLGSSFRAAFSASAGIGGTRLESTVCAGVFDAS